jgi:hypothetical protein
MFQIVFFLSRQWFLNENISNKFEQGIWNLNRDRIPRFWSSSFSYIIVTTGTGLRKKIKTAAIFGCHVWGYY